MKQSFIHEETVKLTIVKNKEELLSLMKDGIDSNRKLLSNLDLSMMDDCCNIDFDGFELNNVVFSRFNPSSPSKKFLFRLSFIGAKLKSVSFAQAHLRQCNFDTLDQEAFLLHQMKMGKATKDEIKTGNATCLSEVDFFFSELHYCRFRRTSLRKVDFRYSLIKDCTMGEVDVRLGDFYYCSFCGCTNFLGGVFRLCSFTCATFEHNCIRMSNIPDGIAQEHGKAYHEELIHAANWMKYNPCASYSSMNHSANVKTAHEFNMESEAFIAFEAANVYKELSGIYAGKGLNRDSNKAYEKSKLLEMRFCKLELKLPEDKRIPLDTGCGQDAESGKKDKIYKSRIRQIYAIRLFGYGFKWKAPAICFLGIVVLYAIFSEVVGWPANILKMFAWSLNNSMSPHGGFTTVFEQSIKHAGTFISSLESVCGVLLVGFLGFIIANKIRNNS